MGNGTAPSEVDPCLVDLALDMSVSFGFVWILVNNYRSRAYTTNSSYLDLIDRQFWSSQ